MTEPTFNVDQDDDSVKVHVSQGVAIPPTPWLLRPLLAIPMKWVNASQPWVTAGFMASAVAQAVNAVHWHLNPLPFIAAWLVGMLAISASLAIQHANLWWTGVQLAAEAEAISRMVKSGMLAAIHEVVRAGAEGREPNIPPPPVKH